jgi:ABC-type branched-subunit amino acid transport system ATPase component
VSGGTVLPSTGPERPQIRVRGVRKAYAGRVVVDVEDLVLGEAPIEGLLGPNGAGKTTLMRLILHSVPLDSGTITFSRPGSGTIELSALPPHRIARSGVVKSTQVITDFEQLTILDSVLLSVTAARHETPWAILDEKRVYARHEDEIWDLLDFFGFDNPYRPALSAGEKKLLDIVRVLLLRPAFLLLDEPTAGLAETLTERVMEKVRQLAAAGTSVVVVEHDLEVIWSLCEAVTFMAEGRVLLKDEPQAIRRDPTVVEKYLGAGHV